MNRNRLMVRKAIKRIPAIIGLSVILALSGCTPGSSPAAGTEGKQDTEKDGSDQKQMEASADQADKGGNAVTDSGAPVITEAGVYELPAKYPPNNEAFAFVMGFGPGINLGNTFDAYTDDRIAADLSNEMMTETYWQTTETTKEVIQTLADAGFKTLRIPVSWHNHLTGEDLTISPVFMNRVNEVVDWALEADMRVILNIHHDNHLEANGFYPDSAHLEQSRRYIERIWQQLAEHYKDYDERLIFEGMNEPRLVGTDEEWWFDVSEPSDKVADAIACINELDQLFVDTVRSVDGKHRDCYLMCPGYDASPDGVLTAGFKMPKDAEGIKDRILLTAHAYTPYAFALEESGTDRFSSSNPEDTVDIDTFMNKLYMKYVSRGTPVVIDEFGARDRNGNVAARADYAGYYTARAWSLCMPCLWWDNNNYSGSGEGFAIYDRAHLTFSAPEIRDALLVNANHYSQGR